MFAFYYLWEPIWVYFIFLILRYLYNIVIVALCTLASCSTCSSVFYNNAPKCYAQTRKCLSSEKKLEFTLFIAIAWSFSTGIASTSLIICIIIQQTPILSRCQYRRRAFLLHLFDFRKQPCFKFQLWYTLHGLKAEVRITSESSLIYRTKPAWSIIRFS